MNAPTDAAAELKPCPVCGGQPRRNGRGKVGGVLCEGQGAGEGKLHRIQTYGATQAEADAAWNTRPPTDAAAVREAAASERLRAVVQGFFDDLTRDGTNRAGQLSIDHDALTARVAEAREVLSSAAAIRQLDLPGGEEVERLVSIVANHRWDQAGLVKHRPGEAPTRTALRSASIALRQALTPARVERSGEGGGA